MSIFRRLVAQCGVKVNRSTKGSPLKNSSPGIDTPAPLFKKTGAMKQALEKLPRYQKRRIQESGVSEDRIKLLYHTIDQAWHKLAKIPLRKAPGVMVKLGMTKEESLLMLMIYFNLKLKLKENGSTN